MKLVKLHRNFLVNKISVILMLIVIFIGLLVNIFSIYSLNHEYNWFEGYNSFLEYLASNILYYKLVMINLICFIWGSSFTNQNNSYHLLITGYKDMKVKFILSKLILLVFLSIIIILCNVYLMSFFGVIWGNFIFSFKNVCELFLNLFLICLIYGLLSSMFSLVFNHNYAYFMAVGLFVLGELIKDGSNSFKLYYVFFPLISTELVDSFGVFHLLFLFIIYFIFVFLGYVYKK